MKIISDTTCHVNQQEAKDKGIILVANQITYKNNVFRDYLDIDSVSFAELLHDDFAKTSQPAVGEIMDAYETTKPEETLHITTGDGLSSAYDSACAVKKSMQANHVSVFHSKSVAGVNRYLTLLASELNDADCSLDEIKKRLQTCISQTQSYVIPTDFNFLLKSGRLTKTAAIIGGFLRLKPVLSQSSDKRKIDKFAITRTWHSAIKCVVDDLMKHGVDFKHKIYVLHAFNAENAQLAIETIKERIVNADIESFVLSPAMITHGGPGCVVIQSVLKDSTSP